jgi:hypothetical protein
MDRKPVLIASIIIISIPLFWNLILMLSAVGVLDLPQFIAGSKYLGDSNYGWLQGAIPLLGYMGTMLIAYALLFCDDN